MSHSPPGPPVTASPPATPSRARSRSRVLVLSGFGGAILGAWFVRSRGPHALPPGFLFSPMMISLALWLVLSLYWEWAARTAAATRSAESGRSRALHLLLVSAAQLLTFWPFAGWPAATARTFEFPRVLPAASFLVPLGLALEAGGLVLAIWARRHLGRNWSGAVTVKVDHELVESGPYRRIRHPIYTGVIAMYVGGALVTARLQGPLAIALVAIAYARKIGLEERNLAGVFGPSFDDYRRRSWAIIPWIV